MTGYTPGSALPFPQGGDAVAVHTDVRALAVKADAEFSTKLGRDDLASEITDALTPISARVGAAEADIQELRDEQLTVTYLGDGVYEIS